MQKKIKKLPIKAKFVELENLHLTITFLGEVKESDIIFLKERLDASLKNTNKFYVKLEELKIIPNENYIRVIGINVKNGDNVSNLIKKVTKSVGGRFYETRFVRDRHPGPRSRPARSEREEHRRRPGGRPCHDPRGRALGADVRGQGPLHRVGLAQGRRRYAGRDEALRLRRRADLPQLP